MLMDANARTGRTIDGERSLKGVLGAYGRDELNNKGRLLLRFAETNKLVLTIPWSVHAKASPTYNGIRGRSTSSLKRVDYIHVYAANTPRWSAKCHNVHPPPVHPAKTDPDQNLVGSTVDLRGQLAHNRPV